MEEEEEDELRTARKNLSKITFGVLINKRVHTVLCERKAK